MIAPPRTGPEGGAIARARAQKNAKKPMQPEPEERRQS
ncbi:MAG: hypothetical protein AVDCRST_MAG80-264 [uncultured Rubrobacteraceae bacterium]|uniref:Uncharacterized protein n=1 Tax=uncultured Rubrobacteraceae bacterium TaxID=349277 RepID=A0A6J4PZH7_9ACTN|nr:MAG: hypothetical protein AVDCRST_MAG80-264 [uncultured Rubrobacteraceae bacterium]